MAFTNQTTHYGLPQWIGSDKPTYLVDQNNAYQKIDSEIYNANVAAGEAVTTANGASATAGAASATAADALSAAQTASTTADSALAAAQDAGTIAQAAQTAAGAAQTAAEAAQQAAAGNSITNLAPAYDSTITYAIDDLVTQDGKLYKCIVAVTSPEQFDINKWDDVTTSEVYARTGDIPTFNSYVIKTIDTSYHVGNDSSMTVTQYLDSAFQSATTAIKESLASNEVALLNFVDYDSSRFIPLLPVIIRPDTVNVPNMQLISGTGGRYDSFLSPVYFSVMTKWTATANPQAELQHAEIKPDNSVVYEDKSSETSPTDFNLHYQILKYI